MLHVYMVFSSDEIVDQPSYEARLKVSEDVVENQPAASAAHEILHQTLIVFQHIFLSIV